MGLKDCISSALDRGAISKDEAAWLSQRADEYLGADPAEAKRLFGEGLRAEEAERLRVEALQKQAIDRIYSDVRAGARFRGRANIVRDMHGMFENFGEGFRSFRWMRDGLQSQAKTELSDFMEKFRRDWRMKRLNRPMIDDVVRALHGENVSDAAKALADGVSGVFEKLRGMFNEAGGHIAKLDDYGLPHKWNASAIAINKSGWIKDVQRYGDWDRIKRPITGLTVPEGEREALLRNIADSIVTDGWDRRTPSSTRFGKGALYNQRDDARFLHFKDADAWLHMQREWGSGGSFASIVNHVMGLARDVAMMRRFGPNPAATVEWMKQVIRAEEAKFKLEQPSMFTGFAKSADYKVAASEHMIDGLYDAARGSSMPFSYAGEMLGMVRDEQYGAKIGSAILTHLPGNSVIQALGRRLQGHSIVGLPMDLIRGFSRNQADEAGLILQDALHHLEQGARQQHAFLRAREITRWLPSLASHWSGLDAFAQASQRAGFVGQMASYARIAGRDFASLPARNRDQLAAFGINSALWDRIRATKLYGDEGRPQLLRPNDVNDREARDVYYELLHGSNQVLVPQSNMKSAAIAAQAAKLPLGQAVWHSMAMFKSGFLGTMWMTQLGSLTRELTRNGKAAGGSHAAALVIALTAGGLLTQQLKQIASGKDPLPMDPTTEQGRATWGKAFMSGGALGFYGDFLSSETSSYGHGLAESLPGPIVTAADDALKAASHPLTWSRWEALLRNDTPVASTHWALRAAFNRVILDQLSYMLDPKAHQKMRATENRIRHETNQGFWWRPGELTPDRPPQFTVPSR